MAKFTGTNGSNKIWGTSGIDIIDGRGGDDFIYGRGGGDYIEGDDGNDRIYGDGGNDQLRGGDGNDRLYGGTGRDFLIGGEGKDFLWGGAERDYFHFTEFDGDIIKDWQNDVDKIRIEMGSRVNDIGDLKITQHGRDVWIERDDGRGGHIVIEDASARDVGDYDFWFV
jgi:Ca2+-binding RTX toxin-like protein